MRLISLKLSSNCPYWFLGDLIRLNYKNNTSEYINIEELDNDLKAILNKSIKMHNVYAFDYDGNKIKNIDEVNLSQCNLDINIEDSNTEEDEMPNIISVTEEHEEDINDCEISEEDIKQAEYLLSKNGNTVRKTIKNTVATNETLSFLTACLNLELCNKNRNGIIKVLNEKIEEYNANRKSN